MPVTPKQTRLTRRLLNRIRAAVKAGKWTKVKWLVAEWLRSFEARRLAVRLAYRKMPARYRPHKSELDAIAKELDAWAGSNEAVFVGIRRKDDDPNDFRHTMSFGIKNRALQYLVLLVLRELVELHPSQYGQQGMHKAIQAVAKAVSEGYVWAIEQDVKDCFASFDGKKVASLFPIPQKVSEAVLIGEHLNVKGGQSLIDCFGCEEGDDWEPVLFNDVLATARRGIPPGSAASSFVAEAVLATVIHKIPKIGVIIAYADNILLMAKCKGDAVAMSNAVWIALKANPAGPFQPKRKHFEAGQPIEFLGHKLLVKNGVVSIGASDHNQQKFMCRVTSKLARVENAKLQPLTRAARIREVERYIRCWTAAFKLCDGIKSVRNRWLAEIPFT